MNNHTLSWWALLCAISLLNVLAWLAVAAAARRQSVHWHPLVRRAVKLQVLLSAGYVLGCAYRSVFPVYDVGRQVLVDSFLSSVMVGRSVATVAELCFAAQWGLLMRDLARAHGDPAGLRVAICVLPMIVTAEICSWHSVLTTSNFGHVIEETLWGLCAAALVVSLVRLWPRAARELRPVLAGAAVIGVGYVAYMFRVDVPMYLMRWVAEAEQGRVPLTLLQGLSDASSRWTVNHDWSHWRHEVVWMTAYFSVAVWTSIALIHMPARLKMNPVQTS